MIKIKSTNQLQYIIEERIEKNGNKCNLNDLDVSNIIDMSDLFSYSNFNGYIDKWNVSKVENMQGMFESSEFNQDISNWDVSKVKNMSYMFRNSKFNQDISKWNVSNVENMFSMFYENESNLSEIKKSVCKWNFNPKVVLVGFMDNPKIDSLKDLKNMCKREQILKKKNR